MDSSKSDGLCDDVWCEHYAENYGYCKVCGKQNRKDSGKPLDLQKLLKQRAIRLI